MSMLRAIVHDPVSFNEIVSLGNEKLSDDSPEQRVRRKRILDFIKELMKAEKEPVGILLIGAADCAIMREYLWDGFMAKGIYSEFAREGTVAILFGADVVLRKRFDRIWAIPVSISRSLVPFHVSVFGERELP